MGNKNKKILLTSALVMGSLLLSITLYRSNHQSNIIYGGQEGPSCEKYWSDSTYTSLNELNQMSSFYDTVTTWGTITDCYDNSAGGKSAFIQSKDAYGNVSGALLYNYGGQYLTPNTTLVEITGIPVWYFG
ncbi:MAG: hypothetical protein PHU89_03165, partial [Bacilli bacterium]|nr:hypothetical protein [Bacilli bacterium]